MSSKETGRGNTKITRDGKMIRVQVQFGEEQMKRLKQASKRLDVSVAEIVRRCVDTGIREVDAGSWKQKAEKAMGFVGSFKSGHRDVARRHDHYLSEDFR